jgi:hypothetical protein
LAAFSSMVFDMCTPEGFSRWRRRIPFVGSGIAMACRQTIERLLADAGHRGHNAPAD